MIYADYAATGAGKPETVIQAVVKQLKNPGNSARGGHSSSLAASRMIYETRQKVSDFFDGYGEESIAFNSGATESLNTAIKGSLVPGRTVITTHAEHNSVLRPLYELERKGVPLVITEPDPSDVEQAIHEHPDCQAVVMTHGSNVTGDVYDITTVGQLCREKEILFIVDCAQTGGIIPISMRQMGIDILCFAGHKGMMGPQGIGGLCVRPGIFLMPLKSGGSGVQSFLKEHPEQMPVRLEAGTLNIPGIAGLGAGIDWLMEQREMLHSREMELTKTFYEAICELPKIRIVGDFNDWNRRTTVVSLCIGNAVSGKVNDCLEQKWGILTRPGIHCAPLMHAHLGTEQQGVVRFSFGAATTLDEIQTCIQAVSQLCHEADASV